MQTMTERFSFPIGYLSMLMINEIIPGKRCCDSSSSPLVSPIMNANERAEPPFRSRMSCFIVDGRSAWNSCSCFVHADCYMQIYTCAMLGFFLLLFWHVRNIAKKNWFLLAFFCNFFGLANPFNWNFNFDYIVDDKILCICLK